MSLDGNALFVVAGANGVSYTAPTPGIAAATPVYDGSVVTSATTNTAPMFIGDAQSVIVVASCPATGSPVGFLSLEGSIDQSTNPQGKEYPNEALTKWYALAFYDPRDAAGTLVTASQYAVAAGGGTFVFELPKPCGHRWVRVVWTKTSGTIKLTARGQWKGVAR